MRDHKTLTLQEKRAKAVIAGERVAHTPRFVKTDGGDRILDQTSLARARRLVGLKGYITNIPANLIPAREVIASYHDLWVRREALVDRVEVRDLRCCSYRSRTVKLRAA